MEKNVFLGGEKKIAQNKNKTRPDYEILYLDDLENTAFSVFEIRIPIESDPKTDF